MTASRIGLAIFARAALQVILVSSSSITISAYEHKGGPWRLLLAVLIGWAISWVWWGNAKAAARDAEGGRWWYATGAAIGTLAGVGLFGWLVG